MGKKWEIETRDGGVVALDDGLSKQPRTELERKERLRLIGDLVGRVGQADVIIATPFVANLGYFVEKLTGEELMGDSYSISSGPLVLRQLDDSTDLLERVSKARKLPLKRDAPGVLNDEIVVAHIDPFGISNGYHILEGASLKELLRQRAEFPMGPEVENEQGEKVPTGFAIAESEFGKPEPIELYARKITDAQTGFETYGEKVRIDPQDTISVRGQIPCVPTPSGDLLPLEVVIGSIGVGPYASQAGFRALKRIHGDKPSIELLVNTAGAVSRVDKLDLLDTCLATRIVGQTGYDMSGQMPGFDRVGQSPYQASDFPLHGSVEVDRKTLDFFSEVPVDGHIVKKTAVYSHNRLAGPLEKLAISCTDLGQREARNVWKKHWGDARKENTEDYSNLRVDKGDSWHLELAGEGSRLSPEYRVGLVDQEAYFIPSTNLTVLYTVSNTFDGGFPQWTSSVGLAARRNAEFAFEAIKAFGENNYIRGEVADKLSEALGPRRKYVTGVK